MSSNSLALAERIHKEVNARLDETNDNLRTHYFYDGTTLFWLPAVEDV